MKVGMMKSIISAIVKKRCRDRIESNIWVSAPTCRRARSPGMKKKGERRFAFGQQLAEWTGLEPATPGVTGRYSNQLNYHSRIRLKLLLVGAERLELPTSAL